MTLILRGGDREQRRLSVESKDLGKNRFLYGLMFGHYGA